MPFEPGLQISGRFIICPACGFDNGEGYYWFEGGNNFEIQSECTSCDKSFVVERKFEVTYYTRELK